MLGKKYWTHRTSALYLLNFIKQVMPLDLYLNTLCRHIFSANNRIIHKKLFTKNIKTENEI